MLVLLKEHQLPDGGKVLVPDRYLRASDFNGKLGQANNPEWKTLAFDDAGKVVLPNGSIGFRWGPEGRADAGKWNLETRRRGTTPRSSSSCRCSRVTRRRTRWSTWPSRTSAARARRTSTTTRSKATSTAPRCRRCGCAWARKATSATQWSPPCSTCRRRSTASTAAWAAAPRATTTTRLHPGLAGEHHRRAARQLITVARQFAENAHKTAGRSMVIIGAAMNHWYHCDMNYRGVINLLMMCGCIGKSGGGWAHYVGQEKLRPQTGWTALAFALDWIRPPRQQNSTSFFYAHTDQWRYEKLGMDEMLSPLADKATYGGSMIDYNVRAERMGWLPSAPQLKTNPLQVVRDAGRRRHGRQGLRGQGPEGRLAQDELRGPGRAAELAAQLFVWRSNLLGSSGKGHEYFLQAPAGHQQRRAGQGPGPDDAKPSEVKWHDQAPEGKLDLLVTLDFRMSTTCLYSDIVLPTATWYEKNDLNTSDMHPFIHPLSAAVDPAWQSRSDWEIYKGFAKKFSEVCVGHLGVEKEVVLTPLMHDTPANWPALRREGLEEGRVRADPRQDRAADHGGRARLPERVQALHRARPLMNKLGNGGKGIGWNTRPRSSSSASSTARARRGVTKGMPKIDTDIDACEVILQLAPETNGHVAVKAWEALGKQTGRDHAHLALYREDEKIRYRDVQAQPRKIISSPTWSGIESETVSYNAGYTNVHELIPWRTLTGRQQFYQDHPWMIAFGEGFSSYRPPVDLKTTAGMHNIAATATRRSCSTSSRRTRSGASTAPTPTT
jgi:nitrate reductase alpha subunit